MTVRCYCLLFFIGLLIGLSEARPCLHEGQVYPPGPVPAKDPCDVCNCLGEGKVLCVRQTVCTPLPNTCIRNVRRLDECCPRCLEVGCKDVNGRLHSQGPMQLADPCENCSCTADNFKQSITCSPRTQCPKALPDGCLGIYNSSTECCPRCITEGCSDGKGSAWPFGSVPTNDPCQKCECTQQSKSLQCTTQRCPPLFNCRRTQKRPEDCCTRCLEIGCPDKYKNNTILRVGPVTTPNRCENCECLPTGVLSCRPTFTCRKLPPNCIRSTTPQGQCCPVCEEIGCVDKNGTAHPVGVMNDTRSGCSGCRCKADGVIECGRLPCPPLKGCLEFDPNSKECCPVCTRRGCVDRYGTQHDIGKNLTKSVDACLWPCECLDTGDIKCPPPSCVPLPPTCLLSAKRPDQCCPECVKFGCRDDFSLNTYPLGRVNTTDPCKNCVCQQNGRVQCYPDTFCRPPPPYCLKTEKVAGKCCPVCVLEGCKHENGKVYPLGPVNFTNICEKNCRCYMTGKIICDPLNCPPALCVDPVTPAGQCCQTCPNGKTCKIDGKVVKFGEVVDTSNCSGCKCGPLPLSKPQCNTCANVPIGG